MIRLRNFDVVTEIAFLTKIEKRGTAQINMLFEEPEGLEDEVSVVDEMLWKWVEIEWTCVEKVSRVGCRVSL